MRTPLEDRPDLCTAVALSAIFITPNVWFPLFLVGSIAAIVLLPRIARPFFRRYGDRVIEPEIKLVFMMLLGLMVLADAANGQAVLPAFILGLVMARHYQQHRQEQERLRVVAFAFLTPFFFLRGGLNVSLGAVFANLGLLALLFMTKLIPKLGLVGPLARRFPHAQTVRFHLGLLLIYFGDMPRARHELALARAQGPRTLLGKRAETLLKAGRKR